MDFTYGGLRIDVHAIGSDKDGWFASGGITEASGARITMERTALLPTRAQAQEAGVLAVCDFVDRKSLQLVHDLSSLLIQ